jgi:putative CocE/NonD family hydrolase
MSTITPQFLGSRESPALHFCDLLVSRARLRFAIMRTIYSSRVSATLVVSLIISLAAISLVVPQISRADQPYAVTIQRGVAVKMRDGVTLRADIYRPTADGKFPVLLTRTPYDKTNNLGICMRVAAAGYVCVSQDVRGRYTSEGEWYPFKHESEDGFDTIEWLAHQPWSTGVIGMWGGSYVGATQMLAALAKPPHLAGIFPIITASDYHENWTYQGGAFEQWFNESWTSGLAEDTMRRNLGGLEKPLEWVNTLPLGDYPVFKTEGVANPAPYFQEWLAHPNYDDYWKQWSIEADYSRIQVPAFHIGAWYDIFLQGSLRNYRGMKAGAGMEFARRQQRMIIEIGGHAGSGQKIGDVDFGTNAPWDEMAVMLRWYDFLFKNINNGMENEKPVRVFTMGSNMWRDFDDWPPPDARNQKMYLHSAGKANGSDGVGSLSSIAPATNEIADSYAYDPANPVQTRGGPLCCRADLLSPGPKDQTDIEKRHDILIYSTEPLTQDLDVTGPVTVELFVKSSAVDTDFTAKLVDVHPDGYAQNITEGILRMRYRDSRENPAKMAPGQIYKIAVDLVATSNVFLAGHRLRVEISSSNYPRFDRNLNTGDPDIQHASAKVVATNTILHDAAHPSALVLSVLPSALPAATTH